MMKESTAGRTERELPLGDRVKRFCHWMKTAIVDLEAPILIFPVLVTAIVAMTFLFPSGKCGAWQWWLAVGFTMIGCGLKAKSWTRGIAVNLMFLLALLILGAISRLILVGGWYDTLRYHMPATRMLIEGWNPVWQGTFDGFLNATGVTADSVWPYHILAMPKAVWYFDAAAYYFTRNGLDILMPLSPVLLAGFAYALWDLSKNWTWAFRLLAAAVAICSIPNLVYAVDAAVAISALGLSCAMYDYLKTGRWRWLRLVVFTFWMAASKQTGLLHCCIFWSVFAVGCLLKQRWNDLGRIAIIGGLAGLLFAIASVSPYVASCINFGHPLYPRYSGDEERYPTKNITADFFDRNADAEAMGHLGAYINAFISSDAALFYYRTKTGRKDFLPASSTWKQLGGNGVGSPTSSGYRFAFVAIILVLLFCGGLAERFIATSAVLGTLAMPTEMIGYTRYTPWALGMGVFCLPMIAGVTNRWKARGRLPAWLLGLALLIAPAIHLAYYIDDAYVVNRLNSEMAPAVVIPVDSGVGSRSARVDKTCYGNLMLLERQVRLLNGAEIICPEGEIELGRDAYMRFPGNGLAVSPECDVASRSEHARLFALSRKERLMAMPIFVLKSFFVTLPKSIWEVLHG